MKFNYHRTLSQNYVFYDRLKDDGYENFYSIIKGNLSGISLVAKEIGAQSSKLFSLSNSELAKEQKLIQNIFGVNLQLDLRQPGAITELINTLNVCLGLKNVFQRNVELIKNSKGKKSVISFFPTYFNKLWAQKEKEIIEKIANLWGNNEKTELYLIASDVITKELEIMVPEAIKNMLNANPELKTMNPEFKNAYQELLNSIGQIQQSGSLANQFYSIYKLDQLKDAIIESIQTSSKEQPINTKKITLKNLAQRGGYSLEAVENAVLNLIASKLNTSQNIKASVKYTGDYGTKPDNIISFNFDFEEILNSLDFQGKVNRERNINLFNEINQKMQNINNSYIVYSSAKNYTYNADFKARGGFSGENIGLATFSSIMKRLHNNVDMLIGAILQTLDGAIGDPSLEDNLESVIAQDIAYFLFDDFDSIGETTTNAIHVFNLNGIYIPLSYLLFALAQAIAETTEDPEKIVKVNINTPSIEFVTREEQNTWQKNNPEKSAWDEQRKKAFDKTKIGIHFLANFQSMVQKYL